MLGGLHQSLTWEQLSVLWAHCLPGVQDALGGVCGSARSILLPLSLRDTEITVSKCVMDHFSFSVDGETVVKAKAALGDTICSALRD